MHLILLVKNLAADVWIVTELLIWLISVASELFLFIFIKSLAKLFKKLLQPTNKATLRLSSEAISITYYTVDVYG